MSKLVMMINAARHNHDREYIETEEVDPVTLRYKVIAVQKHLEPGIIYDLPDALADELLVIPKFGHPVARLPTDNERALYGLANPPASAPL